MTKEQMLELTGRELFERQLKALQGKKLTFRQMRLTSEAWLRHHGFDLTGLGWWKPEEQVAMGIVSDEAGAGAFQGEQRRRVIVRGGEQVIEVFTVVAQVERFLADQRARNTQAPSMRSIVKYRQS